MGKERGAIEPGLGSARKEREITATALPLVRS